MEENKIKEDLGSKLYDTLLEVKRPEYAAKELGWTIAKVRKVAKDNRLDLNIGHKTGNAVAAVASDFDNKIKTLRDSIVPDKLTKQIKEILDKAKSDDLLNFIVRTQVDFIMSGFHVQTNKKDAKKVEAFNIKFDMESVVTKMANYLVKVDTAMVGYGKNGKELTYVKALDPRTHRIVPTDTVKRGVPQFEAYRLTDKSKFKELIEGMSIRSAIVKSINEGKKEWKKVKLNEEPILLRTAEGDRDRYMTPSAISILPQLALRRQMLDGLQTIAYYTKKMIMHIKLGDSNWGTKIGSILQDQSGKPPTAATCQTVLDEFKKEDEAVTQVTGPFWEVGFIAPDPKHLKGDYLSGPEFRIMRWGCVLPFASESGSTYAGGYIEMKPLKSLVSAKRKILTRLLEAFYRTALGIEKIDIIWNNMNLLETNQMAEIMKAFLLNGGSYKTWFETFGFHYDYEFDLHKEEAKDGEDGKDHWPIYEPSQGLKSEDGRPKESDTKPNQEQEKTTERPN